MRIEAAMTDPRTAREWLMTAFLARPGGGNPAGVVLDPPPMSAEEMTRTAVRLNPLSETAFVTSPDEAGAPTRTGRESAPYRIRYFAPGGEVALCGHATAAAYGALALAGRLGELPARVRSSAPGGEVSGKVEREGEDIVVWMDMPVARGADSAVDLDAVAAALGLPREAFSGDLAPAIEDVGIRVALLPLADLAALDAMRPDFDGLRRLGREEGITVFYPFVIDPQGGRIRSRSFAPVVEIDEDPATGTAAASLGAFLARAGRIQSGAELRIRQGEVMGRPSELRLRVEAEGGVPRRVRVGGRVARAPNSTA